MRAPNPVARLVPLILVVTIGGLVAGERTAHAQGYPLQRYLSYQDGGTSPAATPMVPPAGNPNNTGMPPMGNGSGMPPMGNGAGKGTAREAPAPSEAGTSNKPEAQTSGNGNGNGEEAKEEEEPAWSIMNLFMEDPSEAWFKIGGWTSVSMTFNVSSPTDRFNGPVTWTDRSNEPQLNQQWLFLERALNLEDNDIDIGGRVDFLFGTDARFTTASGLEDDFNRANSFYGVSFPQFYGEIGMGSTTIKAGHFLSPVGYFGVMTTGNFFSSLPYTFQYGEPFTHTGVLATQKFSDDFSLGMGITRGWDNYDGSEQGSNTGGFLGTLNLKLTEQETFAMVLVMGNEQVNLADNSHGFRYLHTMVYSNQLTEDLQYVLQSDFGWQDNAFGGGGAKDAHWYGINQYLFYKENDVLTWGINFEWFRDEDGYRVGGFLPNASNVPSRIRGLPTNRTGYAGNFYQLTMGPKVTFNKNFFMRPNMRFDWFAGDTLAPGGLRPYRDGDRDFQALIGVDFVLSY